MVCLTPHAIRNTQYAIRIKALYLDKLGNRLPPFDKLRVQGDKLRNNAIRNTQSWTLSLPPFDKLRVQGDKLRNNAIRNTQYAIRNMQSCKRS